MNGFRKNNNSVSHVSARNNNDESTSNDDCYFFLHSSCTRDDCSFRHEPAARSNKMCSYWKAGNCTKQGCKFLHFDGEGGKSNTECKWESRPGGCCNPKCPFLHSNAKQKHKCSKVGAEFNCGLLLPASLPKMIKNEEMEKLLTKFLEEYFNVFDSDDRQALLGAYCENAMMSLNAVGSMDSMEAYISHSRNLLKASEKQKKQVKMGRLQVVAFLTSLPKTQHILSSFTLDVPFISEKLANFTVTGVFKERNSQKLRHFNRAITIVPQGSGLCILNEIFFITFTTEIQTLSYLNLPVPLEAEPCASGDDVQMNPL